MEFICLKLMKTSASSNWGGIISNVHVTGTVQIEFPASRQTSWSVGGLVGKNSWIIEDSSFDGEVSGVYNVGGIAGSNEGIIRNSRSSGLIRGTKYVGGITGNLFNQGLLEGNSSTANLTVIDQFGIIAESIGKSVFK